IMIIVGALSLILTQGRHEKTFVGKAVTGVVSLYGILGTYGTTSFIGDVLSYSRLLALALTTGIIGMAFNIIAEIVVDMIPIRAFGIAIALLIVIGGHLFNFIMSIMSAFVHSARLIFLEFFGRFYETGGVAFAPFGFRSNSIEIQS
ncbi:MAG: V-type ATP synthase subunit I, partial [Planctomycetota bacterium]